MTIDINSTAQQIFANLSKKDGIEDNKIGLKADNTYDNSIWNSFAEVAGGKQIINYIEQGNALKSIRTYLRRAVDDVTKLTQIMTAGGVTTASSEIVSTEQTIETSTQENDFQYEEIYSAVKSELSQNNVSFDENDSILQNELKSKFNLIKTFAQNNNEKIEKENIVTRLVNYVKGYNYHKFEAETVLGKNKDEYQSDCSKAKSYEDLRTQYLQFGKEFVEFYDNDSNGEISIHEMFYRELIELYIKDLPYNEAKAKALETTEKFKLYDLSNPVDENSELYNTRENELFTEVLGKMVVLDQPSGAPELLQLSSEEAATYLMSTAFLDDEKNNITKNEYIQTELAIACAGLNKEEIMEQYDKTEEEAENILSFIAKFENNMEAYSKFIKTGQLSS